MITERRPDVSPFSAIEFIAIWLSGTFISQPLRSHIDWRLCEGQSAALTVRKWAGYCPSPTRWPRIDSCRPEIDVDSAAGETGC
jgi:hypothetical protein